MRRRYGMIDNYELLTAIITLDETKHCVCRQFCTLAETENLHKVELRRGFQQRRACLDVGASSYIGSVGPAQLVPSSPSTPSLRTVGALFYPPTRSTWGPTGPQPQYHTCDHKSPEIDSPLDKSMFIDLDAISTLYRKFFSHISRTILHCD